MNKKVIIILVNLLVSIALVFVFADPLWNSVKSLRVDIDKRGQEVKKVEQFLAKVQELEKEYQEMGGEGVKDIVSVLPKEKDLPYLMNQFEVLAASNGLLLESLKFNEEIEREGKDSKLSQKKLNQTEEIIPLFPYLSVEIRLNGSYQGLKSYLEDLENSVRLMDVKEIGFRSERDKGGINLSGLSIFKFTLGILVYYQ